MKIPVFVSCPTVLSKAQQGARALVLAQLRRLGLEPRALGRSDYPTDLPLREVYVLATHCSGGVILGFEQFRVVGGTWKPDTTEKTKAKGPVAFPTPWNHLEAGILFSLGIPLLVFREPSISGGVFDPGVTDVFVHKMPKPPLASASKEELGAVFLKWQGAVREHYYRERRPRG